VDQPASEFKSMCPKSAHSEPREAASATAVSAPAAAGGQVVGYHPSWSANPVATWLVEHGGRGIELGPFLAELSERLAAHGVPLHRVSLGVRPMHPEVFARNVRWRRGEAGVAVYDRDYAIRDSDGYLKSPVRLIHEGAAGLRRRLVGPAAMLDFPILTELRDDGSTDYVIMPVLHSTGVTDFVSWTTDRPEGFSTAHLTLLYDLLPLIALRVELASAYDATRTLLTTYLGREPARRVLAGSVRRQHVETIRAAVLVSDVRGYTRMTDRLPPAQMVQLLDDYFERVAEPIDAHQGEVLKFIGDGLLAMFEAKDDPADACRRALAAANEAMAALAKVSVERKAQGLPEIEIGVGLHLGLVQFGNIGARERLDFTVIGPAVNEASRVEALCKVLRRPLLATAAFAEAAGAASMVSLGFHALRGVAEPQEIFGLARHAPQAV
jgi:adenylate cyclase